MCYAGNDIVSNNEIIKTPEFISLVEETPKHLMKAFARKMQIDESTI